MHGNIVIIDMYPVAGLLASAIELRLDITQDIGNLTRDKFLNVLIRTLVV